MISKIKKLFFVNSIRSGKIDKALISYDALCTGELELYDIYAVDGDKDKLLRAAVAALDGTENRYKYALEKACGERSHDCDAGNYFLGNKQLFKKNGIVMPDAVRKTDFSGYTVLYAAKEKEFCGMLIFRDELLPIAKGAVKTLRNMGIKTILTLPAAKAAVAKKRLAVDETKNAILKIEREKVLQELEKGDRILVIDNASDVEKALCLAAVCKRMQETRKTNVICLAASVFLSVLCLPLPWISLLVLANTAAFVLYNSLSLRRIVPCVTDMTEEEKMFGKAHYTIKVGGMSCAHCSARVKSALESIRGVSATVSLEDKVAHVKCPASLDAAKLSDAIIEAGFTVASVEKV